MLRTFADKYSAVVIGCAVLACLGILILGVRSVGFVHSQPLTLIIFFGVPSAAALLLILAFRLTATSRLVVANCVVATGFALLAADVWFAFQEAAGSSSRSRAEYVKSFTGKPYDERSVRQVIDDEAKEGKTVWPFVIPEMLVSPDGTSGEFVAPKDATGSAFLPLANMSMQNIVACNESGEWLIYKSDEHGFRNPSGLWDKAQSDIMILGDSYAFGACVPDGQDVASQLRQKFPVTVNLAASGSGPLFTNAYLSEFGQALRPRVILWLFFEGNDMLNLRNESRFRLLQQYLDTDFRQGLVDRQPEADALLKSYSEDRLAVFEERMTRQKGWIETLKGFVLLRHLRSQFPAAHFQYKWHRGREALDFDLLSHVMGRVKARADALNAKLYLVYLPAWMRGRDETGVAKKEFFQDIIHSQVVKLTASKQVGLIDVLDDFKAHPKPTSLVVYPGSHYNEVGYRLVADAILKRLERDGF